MYCIAASKIKLCEHPKPTSTMQFVDPVEHGLSTLAVEFSLKINEF
jgi:hypothetical protein